MTDERYTEEARRENLIKLATYLENLPSDYQYFGMENFMKDTGNHEVVLDYALNNGGVHKCGTAACAVGHGPAAGILFHEDEIELQPKWNRWTLGYNDVLAPNWSLYAERFVRSINHTEFEFLFGGSWSAYNDTVAGAAQRIRYYLENGVPEKFFDGDLYHYHLEEFLDLSPPRPID